MTKSRSETDKRLDTLRPAKPDDPQMMAAKRVPDALIEQAIVNGRDELAKLEEDPVQDPSLASAWMQFFR